MVNKQKGIGFCVLRDTRLNRGIWAGVLTFAVTKLEKERTRTNSSIVLVWSDKRMCEVWLIGSVQVH
jgi:hypothetical protein